MRSKSLRLARLAGENTTANTDAIRVSHNTFYMDVRTAERLPISQPIVKLRHAQKIAMLNVCRAQTTSELKTHIILENPIHTPFRSDEEYCDTRHTKRVSFCGQHTLARG